ncbi:ABC transporter type 1, transmembrane domain-containing protein [Obelidium mucronatum]|nr:ABC transporter type 1, transmembrane domain-containing protein [Obelidium mucronatum]
MNQRTAAMKAKVVASVTFFPFDVTATLDDDSELSTSVKCMFPPLPEQGQLTVLGLQLLSVLVLFSRVLTSHARADLNARWVALDRIQLFFVLAQLVLSLSLSVFSDGAFLLVEAVWTGVWLLAAAALTMRTRPPPLAAFFVVAAAARAAQLRAAADADSGAAAAAAASLVAIAPSLLADAAQRYWLATFVGARAGGGGQREPCREADASFAAQMTFAWIDALLLKAQEKPLEDEDVWDLADKDKTLNVVRAFKPFQLRTSRRASSTLFYALLACFKWRIIVVFIGCVIGAILDFSKTFFLNRIIVYLQTPRNSLPSSNEYYGLLLLAGLLFGQLFTSTVNGWVFYLARRNAINLRSTLVSEIYEKALRRSAGVGKDGSGGTDGGGGGGGGGADDQKANIGKIVSLMSSDANRLYNFAGFIHRPLVDLPISCIISVSALLYLLGPSALAGLLVVLVSGPLTGLISKWMIKEQLAYASATDNRTQRVAKSRDNELSKAVKLWIYFIGYIVIAWGGSILVVFSSFFCYTVIAGHTLDPATAFTSVTLLHQVGVSLNVLPMIGMQLMRAKVSLDRIADFLKEEELEKYGDVNNPYNTFVSNYRNTPPVGTSSISERTPLLHDSTNSTSHHVQVVVDGGEDDSVAPVTLPPGYVQPTIGFYQGSFMYFGTQKRKRATSTQPPTVQSSPALPKKKWGLSVSLPWSKKKTDAPSEGGASAAAAAPVEDQGAFELRDVSLAFPLGKLSIVTGSTGSGKTTLLLSLLGVAYVAQTAFLLNATIRDNILFGNPYDEARYKSVIEACALVRDLEILEGGDLTEIGEKGINMSGGQKQRISLARAAYSHADICILGPLMFNRTKILVTHATGLVLPHSDYVVVMKNGEVQGSGSLNEVLVNDELGLTVSDDAKDEVEAMEVERAKIALEVSEGGSGSSAAPAAVAGTEFKGISTKGTKIVDDEDKSTGSVKMAVYVSYFRASGGIWFFIIFLLAFILSTGVSFLSDFWIKVWTDASKPASLALSTNSKLEFAENSVYWFLSTRKFNANADRLVTTPITQNPWKVAPTSEYLAKHDALYYITIYAGLSLLGLLVSVLTRLWVLYGGLLGSRALHAKLSAAVFGAPMRFFEKTPVGRLLNRFTKDMATIDNECMDSLDSFFRLIISMVSTVVLILYVAPVSAFVIPVIAFCYSWISSLYLEASRELKRLESVSNSPIYAQFSETLIGVSTVRAFGSEKKFSDQMEDKVDANNRNSFYLWTANRWLNLRCEYLSAVMTSVVGLAIIAAGLDPGWAGLTMIYVFEFTSNLTWLIRCHANMDMAMNAVERVDEYSMIEQEAAAIIPGNRPPMLWPSHGEIHVRNLSLRYQPDLPNVLHDLTFSTRASEKIGVVGRTGAGKSTLTLAFFRILNQFEGQIVIDGIDISKIGLRDLRNRLTIIPQDPVLFEGTLRFNLDPLGAYQDDVIWDAVKSVGLLESMQTGSSSADAKSQASNKGSSSNGNTVPSVEDEGQISRPESPTSRGGGLKLTLDFEVSESGSNFSQGQRQLICMARAILRQTKVFFLDEATASVDEVSDANIQKTIRTSFKDATVVTIAHRLRTIIDYDRVLVLERGKIEEFDTPINLLKKKSGIFKTMCEESGEYSELVKMATIASSSSSKV